MRAETEVRIQDYPRALHVKNGVNTCHALIQPAAIALVLDTLGSRHQIICSFQLQCAPCHAARRHTEVTRYCDRPWTACCPRNCRYRIASVRI